MIRLFPLALLALAAATPAAAQDQRRFVVTGFDRVRVDGAFDVRVTTQGPPGATAEGPDAATDALDIRVEGTTLIVRAVPNVSGERGTSSSGAVIVRLTTQDLRGATVIGGGKLEIVGPLKAQRLDVQVTGSGALSATGIATDQVNAVLLGSGTMTLGGHTARLRLSESGSGALDAAALTGDDLVLRLDGPGNVQARARYTADVLTTGVGAASVAGSPACRVKAVAGGPIRCGDADAR